MTICTAVCLWECPIGGIPVELEFEQCVNSCEQIYPSPEDCVDEAAGFSICILGVSGNCSSAGPGGSCEDDAAALSSCLEGL